MRVENETERLLDEMRRKLEEAVVFGPDGKPKRRTLHSTSHAFTAAQIRATRNERARRQLWDMLRGRLMSAADFAELTGKTPAEVVEINRRLHAVGMNLAHLRARTGRA